MSQYIVSARKYRPDSFESLIGQDNIARTLQNSIKRGQLAHAYLFCGPRGVGKTTTARIFAKMINCSEPGADMEPCGHCESCISFQEGRSYCIHEMDAASNNSVEDIKALMDQVQVPPQVGRYSVYIIDEVHMLSTAAFNAFLKTLEEPPAHAIFILATTEKHKILPTILSRCQTYDFNRISITDIVRNLRGIATKEGITVDDESLHIIAMKADGAMRDALTIFDQTVAFCGTDIHHEDVMRNLNVLDYEYSFRLVDDFLGGNYADALVAFDDILSKGFNALHFIASLSTHLRDLIVARTAGLEALLELPDSLKKRYQEQSGRCTIQWLYDALAATTQCESAYKASSTPRLLIEFTLMKLSFISSAPTPSPVTPGRQAEEHKPKAPSPVTPGRKAEDLEHKTTTPATKPEEHKAEAPSTVILGRQAEDLEHEAPAPAPSPRKRRTAASLSINSIMDEKDDVIKAEDSAATDEGFMPSPEAALAGFKKLAESYQSMPRLANTLANSKTDILEQDGRRVINFYVMNVAQKQWIEEKLLRDLESGIRKVLGTSKIILTVSVTPDQAIEKKPYMPDEKAKDLMAKNEEVKKLVKDLGLDTK